MQTAWIAMQQTAVMFLLMLCGFILFRCQRITVEGSQTLANLLIYLVVPSVLIQSFHGKYSTQNAAALVLCAGASALLLGLAIAVSRLLFPGSPINKFAASFSNAGFLGIPLVTAILGAEAVFYITPFITLLNLLQWMYGTAALTQTKVELKPQKLLQSPIIVGACVGLLLFFTNFRLPEIVSRALGFVSGLNTPVAMLILGVYLAQSNVKSLFASRQLYAVSAVRLLLIPLLSLGVLWLIPIDAAPRLALLLAASAPVGANVAVYCQLYRLDHAYACTTVTLSTLLSIITLPLLSGLGSVVFT